MTSTFSHTNIPLTTQHLHLLWRVFSVKWLRLKENCILHRRYFRYLHETDTIVFTITSAIKRAKLYRSSTITGRVSSFGYVIYSSAEAHCWVCISCRINNIIKSVNFSDNVTRKMKFSSVDGGDDAGYKALGYVKISRMLATQVTILFGTERFYRV